MPLDQHPAEPVALALPEPGVGRELGVGAQRRGEHHAGPGFQAPVRREAQIRRAAQRDRLALVVERGVGGGVQHFQVLVDQVVERIEHRQVQGELTLPPAPPRAYLEIGARLERDQRPLYR